MAIEPVLAAGLGLVVAGCLDLPPRAEHAVDAPTFDLEPGLGEGADSQDTLDLEVMVDLDVPPDGPGPSATDVPTQDLVEYADSADGEADDGAQPPVEVWTDDVADTGPTVDPGPSDLGCTPSCGDAVCGPDGCGGSCGSCPPGATCQAGACICSPQSTKACVGDQVVWVDSCGNPGVVVETCVGGAVCLGAACVCSCDPVKETACLGNDVVGLDSCGSACLTLETCGAKKCLNGACAIHCTEAAQLACGKTVSGLDPSLGANVFDAYACSAGATAKAQLVFVAVPTGAGSYSVSIALGPGNQRPLVAYALGPNCDAATCAAKLTLSGSNVLYEGASASMPVLYFAVTDKPGSTASGKGDVSVSVTCGP